MSEIVADPLPHIPDDLTIPQFFLDTVDPQRPVPKGSHPWLVEDATGRQIGYEEVRGSLRFLRLPRGVDAHIRPVEQIRARTYGLANELSARWNICAYTCPRCRERMY